MRDYRGLTGGWAYPRSMIPPQFPAVSMLYVTSDSAVHPNLSHSNNYFFLHSPQGFTMPTITSMRFDPVPMAFEQLRSVRIEIETEIELRVPSAGPITIRIRLDDRLPYFFNMVEKQVREIRFTRDFKAPGNHKTRFTISLGSISESPHQPLLTATAAGIDGSSPPFTAGLEPGF